MGEERGKKPMSFIVRLWLEPTPGGKEGKGSWRGHIQSVQSGQGIYFHDLRQMLDFLEEVTEVVFPYSSKEPEASKGGSK
jgi:hypothetical protein